MENITSCVGLIDFIGERLDVYFRTRRFNGVAYKSDADAGEFKCESPFVYKFLCPPDQLNDAGYPERLPSVTVVVDAVRPVSNLSQEIDISLHLAIAGGSTSDRETFRRVSQNVFAPDETDGYSAEYAQIDLYKSCLLFMQAGLDAVGGISYNGLKITNIRATPPDLTLSDWPYTTCAIYFTCEIMISKVAQNSAANELREKIDMLMGL